MQEDVYDEQPDHEPREDVGCKHAPCRVLKGVGKQDFLRGRKHLVFRFLVDEAWTFMAGPSRLQHKCAYDEQLSSPPHPPDRSCLLQIGRPASKINGHARRIESHDGPRSVRARNPMCAQLADMNYHHMNVCFLSAFGKIL